MTTTRRRAPGAATPRRGRRPRPAVALPAPGTMEVVHFTVGPHHFAVARGAVRAIRPSPRVRSVLGAPAAALPLVSLSAVLGLERDTAVDRRVLEVLHWQERLGLEVTSIEGIQLVPPSALRPLPPLVARSVASRAVLGLAELPTGLVVVLDLPLLLTERGVGG